MPPSEQKIATDKQAHAMLVCQRFDDFQQKHQHCDFKVGIAREEIPVHRSNIAAGSDYFNAMFSHDTLESQNGVVEIRQAYAESVKKCIDFMYNRDVSISTEKCGKRMHVAHLFQLQALCNHIAIFYGDRLDAESFFDAKKVANMYNSEVLEEKCDQFALENFRQISDLGQFLHLEEEYISFLMKSKDMNASEGFKIDALLRWVKVDVMERKKYLIENLKLLDLLSVPLQYRRQLVEKEKLVFEDNECLLLFMRSVFDSGNVVHEDIKVLEKVPDKIVVFDISSQSLQKFDPVEKTWKPMQAMDKEFANKSFSAVVLAQHIYVLLGDKSVYSLHYTSSSAKWLRVGNMMENHGHRPPATVMEDCIYVVGGSNIETRSVERYVPSSKTWFRIQSKQVFSSSSSAAALKGLLYSIAGSRPEIERFDPGTLNWNFVAQMKQRRQSPAVTGFNGKLYVFGGYLEDPSLSSTEYYNPETNNWTMIAPMKVAQDNFRALCLGRQIFAVGGYDRIKNIEKYDTQKNEWEIAETWDNMVIEGCASVAI